MMQRIVTVPDLILFAGTRVALGVGIGLLLSRRIGAGARDGAGWALVAVGAMTTVPLAMKLRTSRLGPERGQAAGDWARNASAAAGVHSPS